MASFENTVVSLLLLLPSYQSNCLPLKQIAITGAASGMGLATAKLLASRGALLSLADLSDDALQKVITNLPGGPSKHLGVAVDVRKADSVQAWIDKTVEKFGKLDGAVNMAGVLGPSYTSILDTTEKDLDFVMSVNVNGVFNCLKSQIKALKQGGAIVSFCDTIRCLSS